MKKLFLGTALALFSLTAMESKAVTTSKCPNVVDIQMKNLKVTATNKQLDYDFGLTLDYPGKKEAFGQSLKNVEQSSAISRSFSLERRQSGVCTYRGKDSIEKAELYTRNGKSMLLFQINIGPGGILLRAYAEVTDLLPNRIQFNSPVGLALAVPRGGYTSYDVGGSLGFIGQTNDFKVSAR